MRALCFVPLVVVLSAGCQQRNSEESQERTAAVTAPVPSASAGGTRVEFFGEKITPAPTVALATVLADPKAFEATPVTVEGTVRRACTRKGCWMELRGEDDKDRCRVTFKDYGFFVPTDSAGSQAKVQGMVQTKLVTAGHVEHLEAEGAVFPNKHKDGSALEVRLVASGVEMRRSGTTPH